MKSVAFALRDEYQGTTTVEGPDGPEERQVFGGGLLAVDGADFDLRDELDAGGGVITCRQSDAVLVELLDHVPVLERTDAPDGARPISPHARRTTDDLRHFCSLRDLDTDGGREALQARLDAYDIANEAGDQRALAAVRDGDDDVIARLASTGQAEPDGLERLNKADLEALAKGADPPVDLEGAKTNADITDRLRARGVRKED